VGRANTGFRSLTFKVNTILLVALAVGIGAVMAAFTASLVSTRDRSERDRLNQEGDILYTSIANFMLPGQAPLAVTFISQVGQRVPDTRILLYRSNGDQAFSDNSTIDTVNTNLGKFRFEPRARKPALMTMPAKPRFEEAASIPPSQVFFRESEGGRSFFRAYRPLINLPKCSVCHGSDHTVRGVIDIRSDISSLVRTQNATLGLAGIGFFLVVGLLVVVIGAFLRRVVLAPVQAIGRVCANVTAGRFEGRVEVRASDEIGELARTVNTMVEGLYERLELTKYVSAGTIGALRGGQEPRRVEGSLLFTDVRGFTSYAGSHDPERVVEVLNRLLERQSEIIHELGGDVDKFVGDAVFAVFMKEGGSAAACSAALAIVAHCAEAAAEYDGLTVGVGIARGSVIRGMIGSERRADFTVIGDTVNIASRLCSIAKPGQVIVTEDTRAAAGSAFSFRGPFSAKLKGKDEPQRVWMLEGGAK
jgi:class 3 adenylate cyclase